MKLLMATTIMTTLALTPLLAVDDGPAKRLSEAATVFSEIMGSPDKGIPQDLQTMLARMTPPLTAQLSSVTLSPLLGTGQQIDPPLG